MTEGEEDQSESNISTYGTENLKIIKSRRSIEINLEGKLGAVVFVIIAITAEFFTFYGGFIPGTGDLEGNVLGSFVASVILLIVGLAWMYLQYRISGEDSGEDSDEDSVET